MSTQGIVLPFRGTEGLRLLAICCIKSLPFQLHDHYSPTLPSCNQALATMSRVLSSLAIDGNGTKLAYIDSGAPDSISNGFVYTTIIAVHGIEFTSRP